MDTNKRVERLRQRMKEKDLDLVIIMNFENQFYLSGLKAITYSRPIVYLVDDKKKRLIIPSLEEDHAKTMSNADELYVYHETKYKQDEGNSHIEHLEKILQNYPAKTRVGVEFSSMSILLAKVLQKAELELVNIDEDMAKMRYIKDQDEIEMITESGRLVSLALKHSLEAAKAGMTEIEMDQHGNEALFAEVTRRHPNSTIDFFVMSPSGLERSIMPHVFSNTRQLEEKDIIIHSRQVGLNGYRAECERTFFIGEPTDEQRKMFQLAYEAQQVALEVIDVGVTAKEVNEAARRIFANAGVEQYSIHRTGHGIGVGLHEEPSLRYDNDLVLQAGMVFCVEPAIYIPGIGGFRHSDTVVLTEEGTKLITEYPRELEALIF